MLAPALLLPLLVLLAGVPASPSPAPSAPPGAPVASASAAPDPFAAVRFLEGEWTGESDGEAGRGTAERSYHFVLGGRYLHERSVSTYPPQPANKEGEVHEHWSFLSYDRARRALVLRQFHQEGFVNQYAQTAGTLAFESEALENSPAGSKARESYQVISPDEFVETFELAWPGQPWQTYVRTRFKRKH